MIITDLTHTISPVMPVYPGTEKPIIVEATTIEKNGFAEKCITLYSHTGTHIDSPGHMLSGRHTLDQFSAAKFMGRGIVIDVVKIGSGSIEKHDIELYTGEIEASDFVLFNTGWDKHWNDAEYFSGFPVLSKEATAWLCGFPLKGIGLDCISIDPVGDTNMENHTLLFERDMIIIENLCNLDLLKNIQFMFSCLPLKLEKADGSPVRAVGIIL